MGVLSWNAGRPRGGGHPCSATSTPSGKLPLTFPKRCKDCPAYGNFPGACDEVYYGEGIYVGYRYYDLKDVEPLFPFGFGLSYTKSRSPDRS